MEDVAFNCQVQEIHSDLLVQLEVVLIVVVYLLVTYSYIEFSRHVWKNDTYTPKMYIEITLKINIKNQNYY